jgi:hypothetical protein
MTHITIQPAATANGNAVVARLVTLVQYAAGAVLTLAAVAGIARFMDTGLPACDGARVDRTLKAIARANGGGTISAQREAARDASHVACAATVVSADGTRREITYRIFRNEAGRLRVSAVWAH